MELYGLLDNHKLIIENQIEAKKKGYPIVDCEVAYDGSIWEKGYAPEKPAPTHEEISALREQAYISEIDTLHAQRQRKTILGTWTEEDEAEYVAQVKARSEDIANRYPYSKEE